jgi:hypothetical protein
MAIQKVFITHSLQDTDWARSFAQALNQRGIAARLDDFDVKPDDSWADAIEPALRSSDVLVPLLDGEPSATRAFFFELGAAIVLNKRVVPILARGLDPSVLPSTPRLRRYLIRDTPERTAADLSDTLEAAESIQWSSRPLTPAIQ